jgi:N-acetyl-alpha-D-muramate 1-phosphate uridylyltransferase
MRALILSAGLGTRLKPFTNEHPKALAPVNGKPVLQRNIEYLQQYGIDDVIVNVHHFANQIIQAIEENNGWGSNVSISNETNEVLETGGGIKKTANFLQQSKNCVVMNVDILTNLDLSAMIHYHETHNPLATIATTNRETSRYLLFDKDNKLTGWKNIKTGETKGIDGIPKAFSGIHILSNSIFNELHMHGKFSMIDAYLELCKTNAILSYDHSNDILMDIGTMEKLKVAEALFN